MSYSCVLLLRSLPSRYMKELPGGRRFWKVTDSGTKGALFVSDEQEFFLATPLEDEEWWGVRARDSWRRLTGQLRRKVAPSFVKSPGVIAVRLSQLRGEAVITGLLIETEQPLTQTLLRSIPIQDIAAAFNHYPETLKAPATLAKEPQRPGRRGRPASFYAEVAQAYRVAQREAPDAPVQWMAQEYDRNPSTIHRWLAHKLTRAHLEGDSHE